MALQGNAKLLLGRRAIGACPGIMNSRDAAAVWRYDAEQFHDEQLQRREGSAAGAVEISAHRLLKRCSHSRVAAVFRQARHDPEDRVAPLAERHEIVETLEHDVLFRKVTTVAGVLQPIPGYRLFGIFGFAAFDIGESIIDP